MDESAENATSMPEPEEEDAQEDAAIVPLQVPVPKRTRKKKVHSDGVNRDDPTLVAHKLSALETHSHAILDDIAEGLTLQDVMNISVASKVRNRWRYISLYIIID